MRTKCAAHPINEAERLAYLHNLGCLDTPLDPKIERIAAMAARVFDVQSALVTLIDRDRQWHKSPGVWTLSEIAREESFCAHTILKSQVLVCEDTTRDPRFCHLPVVLGSSRLRFYAGAPLIAAEGIHLGAFCVIDTQPRNFTACDQATLQDMAAMVMEELWREREVRDRAVAGTVHH